MAKILCICLSATIQKTISFKNITLEEVNRATSYVTDASGKAVNSARVLNQLEKDSVSLLVPLGKKNAEQFINLAKKDNLNLIIQETPGAVRECLTLLDTEECTTTELVVSEPVLHEDFTECEESLLHLLKENIQNSDAVLLAGSRPENFSQGLISYIAAMVKEKGAYFLADIIGKDLLCALSVHVPDVIKINVREFLETFGYPLHVTEEELSAAIITKSKELNTTIVVTRGTRATFAAQNGTFTEFPTEKTAVVNTTACGDSFNAGFLHEFLKTKNLETALAKGTWCAARNAETLRPGSLW